jgi:3D (Asp-Asp-Asp) domain-containing protein
MPSELYRKLVRALAVVTIVAASPMSLMAEQNLEVTATAYNSVPGQGLGDPTITAWGDKLKPGMHVIGVSPDLVEMGLDHGTEVRIDGLSEVYTVMDKTNSRFQRRIDIYMGEDVKSAKEWGKQTVTIRW